MKPTRLIIVAVGGQGNLLASKVLGEAALMADIPVRMSEIHGMAQRGGVVESAIVFGDARSTIISDGEADVLVGFEPAETLRALNKCNPQTTVISNMAPLPPFTVCIGQGDLSRSGSDQTKDPGQDRPAGRPGCRPIGPGGRQYHVRQYRAAGSALPDRHSAADRGDDPAGDPNPNQNGLCGYQSQGFRNGVPAG